MACTFPAQHVVSVGKWLTAGEGEAGVLCRVYVYFMGENKIHTHHISSE